MPIHTELAAPAFLIAMPQLGDPNFLRAVVLLIEHGEEGSMGLLINQPTELGMGEFCESQEMAFQGDNAKPVYRGGPVQTDRAFIVHASEHRGPETECIVGESQLSYSLESLKLLVQAPPTKLRVYLGYAGWAPEQLAQELAAGAWLLSSADEDLIFHAMPAQVWELALQRMGIEPIQLIHSGAIH